MDKKTIKAKIKKHKKKLKKLEKKLDKIKINEKRIGFIWFDDK